MISVLLWNEKGSTGTLKDVPERREILTETSAEVRNLRRSNTHAADFARNSKQDSFPTENVQNSQLGSENAENVQARMPQSYEQELQEKLEQRKNSSFINSNVLMDSDGTLRSNSGHGDDLSDLGYGSESYYRDQAQFIHEKDLSNRNTIHESFEFLDTEESEQYREQLLQFCNSAENKGLPFDIDDLQAPPDTVQHKPSGFAGQILQPSLQDRTFVCVEAFEPNHPLEMRLNVGDIVQGG